MPARQDRSRSARTPEKLPRQLTASDLNRKARARRKRIGASERPDRRQSTEPGWLPEHHSRSLRVLTRETQRHPHDIHHVAYRSFTPGTRRAGLRVSEIGSGLRSCRRGTPKPVVIQHGPKQLRRLSYQRAQAVHHRLVRDRRFPSVPTGSSNTGCSLARLWPTSVHLLAGRPPFCGPFRPAN